MSIIKGQNLRIFVKAAGGTSKCIAAATSCSIQVQANLEETSTKDSTNSWQNQEAVSKSWNVSTDSLVVIDSTETGMVAFDWVSLIGTEVEIKLQQTNGDQNRTAVVSGQTLTGNAIVQSWSLSAGNKQNATYSVSLEGNGALA